MLWADDWMQHTNYTGGYDRESPQIVWLWNWVRRLKPEERGMHFVSSIIILILFTFEISLFFDFSFCLIFLLVH
jgi:hypothetical protein